MSRRLPLSNGVLNTSSFLNIAKIHSSFCWFRSLLSDYGQSPRLGDRNPDCTKYKIFDRLFSLRLSKIYGAVCWAGRRFNWGPLPWVIRFWCCRFLLSALGAATSCASGFPKSDVSYTSSQGALDGLGTVSLWAGFCVTSRGPFSGCGGPMGRAVTNPDLPRPSGCHGSICDLLRRQNISAPACVISRKSRIHAARASERPQIGPACNNWPKSHRQPWAKSQYSFRAWL